MAYPIKNTTSQQTNTVRTLNFAFGVNQGGYGLTSSTAFWNGRPPNVSGYTAYIGNGTSSPSISLLQNNTDAIQFATNLGCTYCTTIELSLFYILNSGTAISLNIEPPNIVTSGLTLHLDAGFTISYPKGLSTWYDTSPMIYVDNTLYYLSQLISGRYGFSLQGRGQYRYAKGIFITKDVINKIKKVDSEGIDYIEIIINQSKELVGLHIRGMYTEAVQEYITP